MDVIKVVPKSGKRDECTMCTRVDKTENLTIWEISSRHPYRRLVFGLCNFCANELICQIQSLRSQHGA